MSYLSTNTDQTSLVSVSSHDKPIPESHTSNSTLPYHTFLGLTPRRSLVPFLYFLNFVGFTQATFSYVLVLASESLTHLGFFSTLQLGFFCTCLDGKRPANARTNACKFAFMTNKLFGTLALPHRHVYVVEPPSPPTNKQKKKQKRRVLMFPGC